MTCIYGSSVSSISPKLNFTSVSHHKPKFFCSLGDCRSFKDKIEEITQSLAKNSGDSQPGDAATNLIEKLSVEGKDKEEKTEVKEEPLATSEEKKDDTEKQEKPEKQEN